MYDCEGHPLEASRSAYGYMVVYAVWLEVLMTLQEPMGLECQ